MSERFYFRQVIPQVLHWRELGLQLDLRQERLEQLDRMTLQDFKEYVSEVLNRRSFVFTVVGNKKKIGEDELGKLRNLEEFFLPNFLEIKFSITCLS